MASLHCIYDMEGEELYSVKWYKVSRPWALMSLFTRVVAEWPWIFPLHPPGPGAEDYNLQLAGHQGMDTDNLNLDHWLKEKLQWKVANKQNNFIHIFIQVPYFINCYFFRLRGRGQTLTAWCWGASTWPARPATGARCPPRRLSSTPCLRARSSRSAK